MKQFQICATERDGLETRSIVIDLNAEDGMSDADVLDAVKKASIAFCQTEEGKRVYEGNCCAFNYGDFSTYVGNDILSKFGLSRGSQITEVIDTEFDEQLVDESDVFQEEESEYE